MHFLRHAFDVGDAIAHGRPLDAQPLGQPGLVCRWGLPARDVDGDSSPMPNGTLTRFGAEYAVGRSGTSVAPMSLIVNLEIERPALIGVGLVRMASRGVSPSAARRAMYSRAGGKIPICVSAIV
ncbi:hypothetical protein [Solirubrobacter deserti]|uniref:Uncharacterized protein n=1 Tax=Solirubrobacter deserti TaxID=2282478 RepID=A0ABT4RFD7_9ACTN|nr:hypothetical protein [Solirubrobacter deserti]MDA0137261.1 hypothetical protein [Solirubrobacter deserti]